MPILPGDFTGRVAIVTGAARGLGRSAAARFIERGASVAVNVRAAGYITGASLDINGGDLMM